MDIREAIMARMLEIAEGVEEITVAYRNVKTVADTYLPAFIVLEGDEEADDNDPPKRGPMSVRRVQMTPQIVIASGAKPEDIGTELNGLRVAVIKAILSDTQLRDLTLDSTGVRYDGFESDLVLGRTMLGQMAVRFRLTYKFDPNDL